MPPPDLQAIRQHALEQRDLCRQHTFIGVYNPLVELWTAIADAATALDPPLHKTIKKGPTWTTTSPPTN